MNSSERLFRIFPGVVAVRAVPGNRYVISVTAPRARVRAKCRVTADFATTATHVRPRRGDASGPSFLSIGTRYRPYYADAHYTVHTRFRYFSRVIYLLFFPDFPPGGSFTSGTVRVCPVDTNDISSPSGPVIGRDHGKSRREPVPVRTEYCGGYL